MACTILSLKIGESEVNKNKRIYSNTADGMTGDILVSYYQESNLLERKHVDCNIGTKVIINKNVANIRLGNLTKPVVDFLVQNADDLRVILDYDVEVTAAGTKIIGIKSANVVRVEHVDIIYAERHSLIMSDRIKYICSDCKEELSLDPFNRRHECACGLIHVVEDMTDKLFGSGYIIRK